MTTATRTTETTNSTITVKLTREINDKVAYADGYNIKTGREIYESYEITATGRKSGKSVTGNYISIIDRSNSGKNAPVGAYASIGSAYVSEEVYNLVTSMMAEVDAEIGKTAEQAQIEAGRQENAYTPAEPKHGENGYCRKCHSYCYGDCTSR